MAQESAINGQNRCILTKARPVFSASGVYEHYHWKNGQLGQEWPAIKRTRISDLMLLLGGRQNILLMIRTAFSPLEVVYSHFMSQGEDLA